MRMSEASRLSEEDLPRDASCSSNREQTKSLVLGWKDGNLHEYIGCAMCETRE